MPTSWLQSNDLNLITNAKKNKKKSITLKNGNLNSITISMGKFFLLIGPHPNHNQVT
jgi:hypothetical protein